VLAPSDTLDLDSFAHRELFDGIEHTWEALPAIAPFLAKEAEKNSDLSKAEVSDLAHVDAKGVVLGEGCVVEAGAVVKGPALIGAGTQIRTGAYIRGNVVIGAGAVIGNSCEVKNSIIFDRSEVPHYNYVGDAILGFRAHLGAGVILSNVRLDRRDIALLSPAGKRIETGLRKFSAVIGDLAEIGCNSVISPGSIIGRRSVLYPLTHWQGCLAEDTIVKTRQDTTLVPRAKS